MSHPTQNISIPTDHTINKQGSKENYYH